MRARSDAVRLWCVSASLMMAGAAAGPAFAQAVPDAPPAPGQDGTVPDGTGDIVVTAQRRAENLQKVPLSVAAVGGETLSARGVTNLSELPDLTPGLRAPNPGNPAVVTFSIRGVGQRDINIHNEGAVALFVDGSYISFSAALGQPLFDVDRVEVLKGPQGTLFGRNATGGLIQIISKKPTDTFDAYATIDYGSYNSVRVEGAIGGPLGHGFSARLSLYGEQADGYIKNAAGPNLNALKALSGRLQLQYKNEKGFKFLLSARATKWPDAPGVGLPATPFIIAADGARRPNSYGEYANYCATISQGLNPNPPIGSNLGGNCYTRVPNTTKDASFSSDDRFHSQYYALTGTAD